MWESEYRVNNPFFFQINKGHLKGGGQTIPFEKIKNISFKIIKRHFETTGENRT